MTAVRHGLNKVRPSSSDEALSAKGGGGGEKAPAAAAAQAGPIPPIPRQLTRVALLTISDRVSASSACCAASGKRAMLFF